MSRVALLIGTGKYTEGFKSLPAAPKDVEAIAAVLGNPEMGGFDQVDTLTDKPYAEIAETIETWFRERQKEDLALLYISGHGVKDAQLDLYFAACNTRKQKEELVRSTAVAASFVRDRIRDSKAKRQIIILDCCFSGAFGDLLSKDDDTINLKDLLGAEGRAVLTSSSSIQYSFQHRDGELSIYTHYLVEGIRTGAADIDGDGAISVQELHDYASRKVQEESPAMSPKIIVLKDEGYQIRIAKAPQDDPKLVYRKELDERAKRKQGKLSPTVRRALKFRWQALGLSSQDAETIESEVLQPYHIFRVKLDEFEQALREILDQDPQMIAESLDDLQYLQQVLTLRDEDVAPVLSRYPLNVTPPLTPPTDESARQSLENQSITPASNVMDESVPESSANDLENDIEILDSQEPINLVDTPESRDLLESNMCNSDELISSIDIEPSESSELVNSLYDSSKLGGNTKNSNNYELDNIEEAQPQALVKSINVLGTEKSIDLNNSSQTSEIAWGWLIGILFVLILIIFLLSILFSLPSSDNISDDKRFFAQAVDKQINGDYKSAIALYDQAIQLKPDSAEAYRNRCMAYDSLGDYQKAISDCNKAIQFKNDYVDAYATRANIYSKLKDYEKELSDENKAIEIDSSRSFLYSNRGGAFFNLAQYPKSIEDYSRAIQIDTDWGVPFGKVIKGNYFGIESAYFMRGIAQYILTSYQMAIEDFTKAIQHQPLYSKPYYWRGAAYKALGKNQASLNDFKRASELFQQQNRTKEYQDAQDQVKEVMLLLDTSKGKDVKTN